MVAVPTSKTCTMAGPCLARKAAIAAGRVSGYEPLNTALTLYSDWDLLNWSTMWLTASPSAPPIACHHWISVCAAAPCALASTAAAAATDDSRIRDMIDKPPKVSPGSISVGLATSLRLFYFILVTVPQDYPPAQPPLSQPSARRTRSGAAVMMQSAPMPRMARASSGSFTVQTERT